MLPTSVAGGLAKGGSFIARAGFCGPGSENAAALALIAPCGGRSGLPNTPAACAAAVLMATPPVAPAARIHLLESFDIVFSLFLQPSGRLPTRGSGACGCAHVSQPPTYLSNMLRKRFSYLKDIGWPLSGLSRVRGVDRPSDEVRQS